MESILESIKKLLGIPKDYTAFDVDVVVHINTAFAVLSQLRLGPDFGFRIEGSEEVWADYIVSNNMSMDKTFIYLNVRLAFDPPSSTALIESRQRTLDELTWRLEIEGQNGSSG